MRLLLSEAASQGETSRDALQIMLLGAKKAHLHAQAERPIFVQLPPERARPGCCCRLLRSQCGARGRGAPRLWEEYVAACLTALDSA